MNFIKFFELILTLSLRTWGADLCEGTSPSVCFVPSSIEKTRIEMCEAEKKAGDCEAFYKANPAAALKSRRCDVITSCPTPTKIADYVRVCKKTFVDAGTDLVYGAVDFVAGSVKFSPEIKAREEFFASCTSAQCKAEMLGPYADLFKIEEIRGHANTKGLNAQDPVNSIYLNGYSAKTLYNKLLNILKKQSKNGSTKSYLIEPWSGQPALQKKSVEELADDVLTRVGLSHEACYDPAVVAELRCYALFVVLDPIAGAGILAKMRSVAGVAQTTERSRFLLEKVISRPNLQRPNKKLRALAEIADAKDRVYMRPAGVDAAELKRSVDPIWANDKLTSTEKLKSTFDKYTELRMRDLPESTQEVGKKALSNIKDAEVEFDAYWDLNSQDLAAGSAIRENELASYTTLVHEFEHLTQYSKKGVSMSAVQEKAMQEMLEKGSAVPSAPVSFYQAEFEAVASQWDFLQAVPAGVRDNAVKMLQSNTRLPKEVRNAFIEDIRLASLTREDYIKQVPYYHGYSNYNTYAVVRQIRNLVLGGVIVNAAAVAPDVYKGVIRAIDPK